MRDTKLQRATVSETAFRDATGTPTRTAPALLDISQAALLLLAAKGARGGDPPTWRFATQSSSGTPFEVVCSGPDLPAAVSPETIHPSAIPKQRNWVGRHRLSICAPLRVLELHWNAGEPLRIMQFSRGIWEDELRAMAP